MHIKSVISKTLAIVFTICTLTIAKAQPKHFIYIQSENSQAFTVILNSQDYRSGTKNYLIIPRLRNGKYLFSITFPDKKFPEQKFICPINDKDLGYVLKQIKGKEWVLADLVNGDMVKANPKTWQQEVAINDTSVIKNDEGVVAAIMSKPQPPTTVATSTPKIAAKKDTVVTTATLTVQEPVEEKILPTTPPDPVVENYKPPVVANNTTASSNNDTQTKPVIQQDKTAATKTSNGKQGIVKVYEKNGTYGTDQVYIDYTITPFDTITVFVPIQAAVYTPPPAPVVVEEKPEEKVTEIKPQPTDARYNTTCVNLVTEVDYARVRRLMSAETTDQLMIDVAKATNKNRCYTIEQVKKLGLLFISEASRYKFFIAIRPMVYDVVNYASLETEFSLANLIDQFRKSVQ